MTRFEHREMRRVSRLLSDSKPVLVEALRNMPTVCPPRVAQQRKADLERIVRGALWRDDADPVRLAMQTALQDARRDVALLRDANSRYSRVQLDEIVRTVA